MLRRNELVSEVKKILNNHGSLWYDVDTEKCAKEIVERVLTLIK